MYIYIYMERERERERERDRERGRGCLQVRCELAWIWDDKLQLFWFEVSDRVLSARRGGLLPILAGLLGLSLIMIARVVMTI